eukprot:c2753_g2_i1 orf=707-910(-)
MKNEEASIQHRMHSVLRWTHTPEDPFEVTQGFLQLHQTSREPYARKRTEREETKATLGHKSRASVSR